MRAGNTGIGKGKYKRIQVPCPRGCGRSFANNVVARHASRCFFPRTFDRLLELGGHAEAPSSDTCWTWVQNRTINTAFPYGYVRDRYGVQVNVHRVSLSLKLGRPIRNGMLACHTCDNPKCFNPGHLYEGTYKTNAKDRADRGRNLGGDGVSLVSESATCFRCHRSIRPGLLSRHEKSCFMPETPERWYEITEAAQKGNCLVCTRGISNGLWIRSLCRKLKRGQIPAWLATKNEPSRSLVASQLCETKDCVKIGHWTFVPRAGQPLKSTV